jgi:dTMP kinase
MKNSGLKSLFITFEGGEGSGKSVQSRILYRRLSKLAIQTLIIHEPGSTPLGERLSRLVKSCRSGSITATTELLLFNAARAQLVSTILLPSLNRGSVVICDRYTDSTLAYQGYGRGLKQEIVRSANEIATGGLKPDLTILLDVPVREGLERKRNNDNDRFQSEEVAFHERVRRGYLTLARKEPNRFFVINGTMSKQSISQIIWQRVNQLLFK